MRSLLLVTSLLGLCLVSSLSVFAGEKEVIPHAQKKAPGPALTPDEAMAKMQLPPDFTVQLVISEPAIVNPTAFTFDEKGRIWICESVEYPRASAGKGTDRIKILEDINHNGKFEKVTIFKDGLNIPCGIALGDGGVYVTNSPDILFLQDTDGDGVADKEEVILTGFGRDDRHELPNSLTFGPDGWLYGMNGVFNRTKVAFDGKNYDFTCAIWRYHRKWKKFELFAEGTSNPWGLDFNAQGDWFVSCCVIDHLFHMTQSGYYQRQGGPYPPFTHALSSITKEKHQQAAYAGLCIYQGDAYPEENRGIFFMGNLHGGCINRDILSRNGATYVQKSLPDFLSANDAWFMPVAQKVGPDGCIYIMDWYDKYHCYQDANRDPKGLDRTRGRIYRIAYKDTPLAKPFDLGKASQEELLALLSHTNIWQRREAQRILNEKFNDALVPVLQKMALDTNDKTQAHMHALWLLCSQEKMDPAFHAQLLSHADPVIRNWGVRAAGQIGALGKVTQPIFDQLKALAKDPSPDVRAQVVIAAGRMSDPDPLPIFFAMLTNPENASDPLIPTIIYNNLKPRVKMHADEILSFIEENTQAQELFGKNVLAWTTDVLNASGARSPEQMAAKLKRLLATPNPDEKKATAALRGVIDGFAAANVKILERGKLFDESMRTAVGKMAAGSGESQIPAAMAALWWNDPQAAALARKVVADPKSDVKVRIELLQELAANKDTDSFDAYAAVAAETNAPAALRKEALEALGSLDNQKASAVLLETLKTLPPELKALCIGSLVHTPVSAAALMDAVEAKQVSPRDINTNHVRQIVEFNDAKLTQRVVALWGTVRTERDPERVEVIKKMREVVGKKAGNAFTGWKVFEAKCQQCHAIYGKGNDVGPELTGAGRETLDAILTNVLDPSLVIGKGYEQYVAKTKGGKIVTGLLAEDSEKRVVLKQAGGVLEAIAKDDLVKLAQQSISLMPEGLEKNMTEDEFCDLVAFLMTTSPPTKKK